MKHVVCMLIIACILIPPSVSAAIETEPQLKVAFIGDTEYGTTFESVLTLIKNEGADAVVHLGDFDYAYDADGFFAVVDASLGPTYPYFIVVGNHDLESWNEGCGDSDGCYASFFKERLNRLGIALDDPNLNDQMNALSYKGLKIVMVGEDDEKGDSVYAPYIESQFASDDHTWNICAWHKNQRAMQVGNKSDEMGWAVYENCKEAGAIIATAHEHSYQRTKTLIDFTNQLVDPVTHPMVNGTPSNPNELVVADGKTFAFVSGLGGASIREQQLCLPATYPYGCGYWGHIYTETHNAQYGALFIEFNVDNDPGKARGYFKNINGQIIDSFSIRSSTSGDVDGDSDVDIFDYNVLLSNFGKTVVGRDKGDLDGDSDVDIFDYNLVISNFGK